MTLSYPAIVVAPGTVFSRLEVSVMKRLSVGLVVGLTTFVPPMALGQVDHYRIDQSHIGLINLGSVHIPGGVEIVSFDSMTGRIYAIGSSGWMVFDFNEANRFSVIDSGVYSSTEQWEPTSIAIDPAERGFVVCSWIPNPSDRVPGMAQVLDTQDNQVVWQFEIGYHPDCLAFSPDGRYLIAANECEPGIEDRAGGITIVDLDRINTSKDFAGLNDVRTFDFSPENLGDGVSLDALRIGSKLKATPEIDIEPEYLAPTNDGVWVGLQENNGLAYFDFELNKWTRVQSLGSLSLAFDSNDGDGVNITTQAGFALLPQPDTIAATAIGDRTYIVFANEGEGADADTTRLEDAIDEGLIDRNAIARLHRSYPGEAFSKLGRVWISTIDGDLDQDGDIDVPSVLGGRSFSIIDAQDGSLVWNSGSQFERITAERWPKQYNSDDSRSDRAGPEPEGIAIRHIDGRTLVFVGLERADAVFMYDISNPETPIFLDAQRLDSACSRPEGIAFFTMYHRSYLAVASEKGGCLTIFEVK